MNNENYLIGSRFDYTNLEENNSQKEEDKSSLEVKCFRWGMPCRFCDEYAFCPALKI